jgi:GGDEF domain-containing protein
MMVSIYGSKSIEQAVDAAAAILRRGDVVCQWDGDKLGICLWGTDETGAKVVGRRIKRELEKSNGVRAGVTYEVLKGGSERPILGALERAF